ncbi:hypothetical protein KEM52_006656 [Ascosphaera acerosa]|nr:hypothetical protein KEM52_006656 [Ascosphaera acerosa]
MNAVPISDDAITADMTWPSSSLGDIPLALLQAELRRRTEAETAQHGLIGVQEAEAGGAAAPAFPPSGAAAAATAAIERAACGSVKRGDYNTPLHVFALVLILAVSTFACAFPIIARRFPRLPIPRHFLFLSRHFGTGVLLATAFVHLLPTAFVSLTDPCLPYFWTTGYPAMPGFVSMIAVFSVVAIEMFFATRGAGHSHDSAYDTLEDADEGGARDGDERAHGHHHHRRSSHRPDHHGHAATRSGGAYDASTENLLSHSSPLLLPKSSIDSPVSDSDSAAADSSLSLAEVESCPNTCEEYHDHHRYRHSHGADARASTGDCNGGGGGGGATDQLSSAAAQKQLLQCLLLEAGILFHSVFIGMALSVETGAPFIVLLIAIVFHQTFEGLALGARIAALIPTLFPASSPKPWLMALAYGLTTPIGQAIGLAVHNLYDPQSATGLLMVGLTNAFSSGLLLFAGLVELLAEDFLSDRSYETLRGGARLQACGAVFLGAMLMAFVGAFA